MMKRLFNNLTVSVLSVSLLLSAFCVSAHAETADSKAKERLKAVLEVIEGEQTAMGMSFAYYDNTLDPEVYQAAKSVYENSASTGADYTNAYVGLLKAKYSSLIKETIPRAALEEAEKEQNYNHWYPEDEWQAYQAKVKALRTAVDDYSATYQYIAGSDENGQPVMETGYEYSEAQHRTLDAAFHEWLYALNVMTNKDHVNGDVDGNGKVTINDATVVQKYLCGAVQLTTAQKMRARAVLYNRAAGSGDNMMRYQLTVNDATQIQRFLAGDTAASDRFYNSPLYEQEKVCIFVDELDSYEDKPYLLSHFFNYFVCPGSTDIYPFDTNYYLAADFQKVYHSCEALGIDYKL